MSYPRVRTPRRGRSVAACLPLVFGIGAAGAAESARPLRPTFVHARSVPRNNAMSTSYRGPLAELSDDQKVLRDELRRHVEALAGKIGERNLRHGDSLQQAAHYLEDSFTAAGLSVTRQTYQVGGQACANLQVEITPAEEIPPPAAAALSMPGDEKVGEGGREPRSGAPRTFEEIVVIGAHYDTVSGSPGANDNASGVAALLALARRFAARPVRRTLRFVAFANEEQPYFQTGSMGSRVYARGCRQRNENIVAAISLETIGYYSDAPGSQRYPPLLSTFYPTTGNFIGFVGDLRSRPLVDQVTAAFRRHARFPSEKGALPSGLPGVGWSDHWSFWQEGYPGVMVTDTAPYRYPHYHLASDTPDRIDYERLARVVDGLVGVVGELVHCP